MRKARHAVGMTAALMLLAGTFTVIVTAAIVIHAGLAVASVIAAAPRNRRKTK